MLIDAAALPPGEQDDQADVLIVGAGAVGLTLGIELARRGIRVTILEAGGEQPPLDYGRLNHGTLTGRHHRGVSEGRMRALGGTTRLWGGQLVPFDAEDFAGDPDTARAPWPVSFEEMKPWFAAAFGFLGIDPAASDDTAVWRRATGRDQAFGDGLRVGMNVWLPQADFTRLFADDIARLPTLRIVTDAAVEALLLSDTGNRVIAVTTGSGNAQRRFAAPCIVLANGTLEIVRLLLRTAATAPACGFASNAAIGRGFIDHLHGVAGTIKVSDAAALRELFDNIYWQGRKYGVKLRASELLRRSAGIGNCAATLYTPTRIGTMMRDLASVGHRILRGKTDTGGPGVVRTLGDAARMTAILVPLAWRYFVSRRSTSVFSRGVYLGIEVEQLPTMCSHLTLDTGEPPMTAPIAVHWQLEGREIEAVATVCEAVAAEFAARGLGTVTLDPRVTARDPAFLDDCHDAYHQMGGARMGEAPGEAVVDRDLRVFGADNLYVLGAAVFPSGSFANPTLTAIALALRLADRLASRIRPC